MKPRGLNHLLMKLAPHSVKAYQDFVAKNLDERLKQANIDEKSGKQTHRDDMLSYLINVKDGETGKPA